MAKKSKYYVQGVKDALEIMNYHYFGKEPEDERRSRKNMRNVMTKADEKGTASSACWNFFTGMKKDIGELADLSEQEIIGKPIKKVEESVVIV